MSISIHYTPITHYIPNTILQACSCNNCSHILYDNVQMEVKGRQNKVIHSVLVKGWATYVALYTWVANSTPTINKNLLLTFNQT